MSSGMLFAKQKLDVIFISDKQEVLDLKKKQCAGSQKQIQRIVINSVAL